MTSAHPKFLSCLSRIRRNDSSLEYVELAECGLGDDGARRLAEALRGNTFVKKIDLYYNNIGPLGAGDLAKHIGGGSSSLIELHLSGNRIGDVGAGELAKMLGGSSVKVLNLCCNGIGPLGASELAKELGGSSSLSELHLGGNSVGDAGAGEMAKMLVSSSIKVINLCCNGIGPLGVSALAEGLGSISSITLYLAWNPVGNKGATSLAKSLLVNSSLVNLSINCGDKMERTLNELVRINRESPTPQEALGLKIELLLDSTEDGAHSLGFGDRAEAAEAAVSVALDRLGRHFAEPDQRRTLLRRIFGGSPPGRGARAAGSVETVPRGRALYRYAAQCGSEPEVLANLLRAHPSLKTCRDVRHRLYPFALLAAMEESTRAQAGEDDDAIGTSAVMEALLLDPSLVEGGIPY